MSDCVSTPTPIIHRLSEVNGGEKLSPTEHEQYRNMVGSLLYLACSKMACSKNRPNVLWGFVDSDWAGCPDSRRSTSGYALMLNCAAIS